MDQAYATAVILLVVVVAMNALYCICGQKTYKGDTVMGKKDIKDMDLFYGSFQALKNVNLEIEPNKITAFISIVVDGKIPLQEV